MRTTKKNFEFYHVKARVYSLKEKAERQTEYNVVNQPVENIGEIVKSMAVNEGYLLIDFEANLIKAVMKVSAQELLDIGLEKGWIQDFEEQEATIEGTVLGTGFYGEGLADENEGGELDD